MTEEEAKTFPVGQAVRVIKQGHSRQGAIQLVEYYRQKVDGEWAVMCRDTSNGSQYGWAILSSIELTKPAAPPKSDVEQWFDEKLAPAPAPASKKKEWEPDKGINWDAHRTFIRNL